MNWFAHSWFVPEQVAAVLNRQLDDGFSLIRQECSAIASEGFSVHVTGSLGRQEPAVLADGRPPAVTSDIDLVVVGPADRVRTVAGWLEDHLAGSAPRLRATAFGVAVGDLPRVRSFVAHDLRYQWTKPIVGSTPPGPLPAAAPTPADHFELVVHQLASWLLYPEDDQGRQQGRHFREDAGTHRVKAHLEGVRLLAACLVRSPGRYADLVRNQEIRRAVCTVLPEERVDRLLRARELSERAESGGTMGDDIIRPAMRAFLGVSGGREEDIRMALVDYADRHRNLLDGFRAAITLHYLEKLEPGMAPTATKLRESTADVLESIPEGDLAEADARSTLVRALRHRATPADHGLAAEGRLWLRLREDYSAALGDRNFGRLARTPTTSGAASK